MNAVGLGRFMEKDFWGRSTDEKTIAVEKDGVEVFKAIAKSGIFYTVLEIGGNSRLRTAAAAVCSN